MFSSTLLTQPPRSSLSTRVQKMNTSLADGYIKLQAKIRHTLCSFESYMKKERKLYVCTMQFTATNQCTKHVGKQLIWADIWVYSHSYRLAIYCTTNSSQVLRRRGRKIWKIFGKKHNFYEHPVGLLINKPYFNFGSFVYADLILYWRQLFTTKIFWNYHV